MKIVHLAFCCLLFVVEISASAKFKIPKYEEEKEQDFWMDSMKKEINEALRKPINTNVAKNIIIFVGDGLGITPTTAGRIYKGQKKGFSGEEFSLSWENFPNNALIKTYNLDAQVPDSAATATAFFGGIKNKKGTLGVHGKVNRGDCEASLSQNARVSSVLQWAQDAGKDTGFVTNTRITHATPAALYAHSPDRDWESDSSMNASTILQGCKDIARQLVEDIPGKNTNVILGGGRKQMGSLDTDSMSRNDSRNLVEEWAQDKLKRGKTTAYAVNTKELLDIDAEEADYIMGLFGDSHMSYESLRDKSSNGEPSLQQMVEVALKRLKRSDKGFFLMVEGGRIDHALHETRPRKAMEEISAFDDAIKATLKIMGDDEDTLIIVTADHSHVMTINGYPERGNNILGLTNHKDVLEYPTLMFTTGHGFFSAFETDINGDIIRKNLSGTDTTDLNYISPSVVGLPLGHETHGGEDIATYAKGPMSHLFHKVHEQAYIAHVMGFAACIGPYQSSCGRPSPYTSKENLNQRFERSSASSVRWGALPTFVVLLLSVTVIQISNTIQ